MGQVVASKDLWECCGEEEACPLHKAASSGRAASVQRLLRARASVHTWDISGCTPVHLAAENGHLEVLHLLLSSNGHVDVRDVGGRRPLHKAAEAGATEAIRLLLLGRADVEARDIDGMSPAHTAAAAGTLTGSVLRVLLEGRVDVRAKNRYGAAPVDLAASSGHPRVLRWLRGTELDPKTIYTCPIFPKPMPLQDDDPEPDQPVVRDTTDVTKKQVEDLPTANLTTPRIKSTEIIPKLPDDLELASPKDQSFGSPSGSADVCRHNPLISQAPPNSQPLASPENPMHGSSRQAPVEPANPEESVAVRDTIQRNRRHVSC